LAQEVKMTTVVVPSLGEGVESAMVSYWYVKTGQQVKKDEVLVELTTDKAAFNLPSPCSGRVAEIRVPEGTQVKVGLAIATIEE
jgi:pyruvate/2-oxoglutarate dehydrogenase complex dihydrolipoamide acyltransferase (E2) component